MKKYEKMEMKVISVNQNNNISTLTDWLDTTGETYSDAGITTYYIES